MTKEDIKDLTLKDLEKILVSWGYQRFRAGQIFSWIYKKGAKDFDSMSDLPSSLRRQLKDNFNVFQLQLFRALESKDKTKKFLFQVRDENFTQSLHARANFIEAVIIPAQKRITACVSSQVGCKYGCGFCASGMLGFKGNLTCGQILEEVLYLKNSLKNKKLTHIVFMGIGEPLDNYDNVLKAIRIINSAYAFNIGARRITISTCGIIPGIKKLADESLQTELSISLHAACDKLRSQLLPVDKKYPLNKLISTCKEYIKKTNRQITFEYVLIKEINSDLQNAKKLSKILDDLKLAKVNLIPANPVKELNVYPASEAQVLAFRDYLLKQKNNVTLRRPRGQDIEAACGQLRLRYEDK